MFGKGKEYLCKTKKKEIIGIWTKIQNIARRKVDNYDIYRINSKFGETEVSKEHSLIFDTGEKLEKIKPEEMLKKEKDLVKIQRLAFERTSKRKLKGQYFADFCTFFGAYVSEGCLNKFKTNYSIIISNNNKEWLEKIRRAGENILGSRGTYSKSQQTYNLVFYNKEKWKWINNLAGKGCKNKKIPSLIFDLRREYQLEFIYTAVEGDGHFYIKTNKQRDYRRHRAFAYTTNSKKLASGMSFLMTRLRMNHSIYYREEKDCYSIFTNSHRKNKGKTSFTKYKYSGYIYDVTTENNLFTDGLGLIGTHNTFMLFPRYLSQDFSPAKTIFWFPSDGGAGLPLNCHNILQKTNIPVAMSKFGQKQVWDYYKIKTEHIPHAVDSKKFYPVSKEEKEKLKQKYGVSGKFVILCFKERTKILMSDLTVKNIENISKQDKVITDRGYSKRVTEVMKRDYDGDIFHLDLMGLFGGITATPEHPILSISREDILCRTKSRTKRNYVCLRNYSWKRKNRIDLNNHKACNILENNIKWEKISNLKVGDFVGLPIPKEVIEIEKLKLNELFDVKSVIKYSKSKIPLEIILDEDFLRLVGYYLAEGNLIKSRGNLNGLQFTFHIDEKEYHKDVIQTISNKFGLTCNVYNSIKGNSCAIRVNNKLLAELFKFLCGEYAHYKRINSLLMKLPPKKQLSIFEGFYRGDGCLIKNKHCKTNKKVIVTASENLAKDLFYICLRNQILINYNKRKTGINILTIHDNKNTNNRFITKDYLFTQIKKIRTEKYKGKVYNFEVEDDNSYIANFVGVHNCVARNQPRKMLDRQLKALYSFKRFADKAQDAIMLLHSDPSDPASSFNMNHQITQLKLNNKVFYTGTTWFKGFTYEQMNEVYNLADVFFLSTSGEGFGVPFIEAMSCGIPVITTDYTSAKELILDNGQAGLLVKLVGTEMVPYDLPETERDLQLLNGTLTGGWQVERAIMDIHHGADCLWELYQDKEKRELFGKNGREKVLKFYDWSVVIKMWDDLLERYHNN